MNPGFSLSIPALNYQAHKSEIDAAVAEVFRSGHFILGPQTEAFEKEFAAYVGIGHCIGAGSGTDALEIALRVCDIGPGDAVLTVSHTAVATVAAIERAGAMPVFVDIDPDTFTISPTALEQTIKEYASLIACAKLKAVIPVHLYGQAADMPAIMEIARAHNLRVIEDCAQSHGATMLGRMTGTWGDLGAFSFYPTKNLGAFGDGGAVVTDNAAFAERARHLRQYGWKTRQISAFPGINSRLDELQSAMLRLLLRHIKPVTTT
jgi:dTDP-4-amino-4,6-dideoxygalactose transaminase